MADERLERLVPQVRTMAAERMTDREIGTALDITVRQVQLIRDNHGIPSGSTPVGLTDAARADMVRAARGPRPAKSVGR